MTYCSNDDSGSDDEMFLPSPFSPIYFTVTTAVSDCKEMVNSSDKILDYDGIICVSGDGLMLEALQGIMQRKDWKAVIERLVVSPLPGNSRNMRDHLAALKSC